MNKGFELILLFIAIFLFGIALGANLYEWIQCRPLAIENGCGQYNSQNGDFEWVKR